MKTCRKLGSIGVFLVVAMPAVGGCGAQTVGPGLPGGGDAAVVDTGVFTVDIPTNVGGPIDTGVSTVDVPTSVSEPLDAGSVSTAGDPCTMNTDCNNPVLMCDMTLAQNECTGICTNNPSQAVEQAECGGPGSTCLSEGDSISATSSCWHACNPTALAVATGACPAGFICTGFALEFSTGEPDSPGCFPYCSMDSQCPMGLHCNPRVQGECLGTAPSTTALADGQPCDPTVTVMVPGEPQPRNIQCRGICYQTDSTNMHQGVCGSTINIRTTAGCPDNASMSPLNVTGDNLAICVFASCNTNADCTAPLLCEMASDGSMFCEYSQDGGTGIPGDAGADASAF